MKKFVVILLSLMVMACYEIPQGTEGHITSSGFQKSTRRFTGKYWVGHYDRYYITFKFKDAEGKLRDKTFYYDTGKKDKELYETSKTRSFIYDGKKWWVKN